MSVGNVGKIKPGIWLTATQKFQRGVWPWTEGIRSRFPLHYKKRFVEKFTTEPKPVHYRPNPEKYYVDQMGTRRLVWNVPIQAVYPVEADQGLWGGEGIMNQLRAKNNDPAKPRMPFLMKPALSNRVFYSEILDKWMAITVTMRTLDQIDEAGGFDYYILKTHEVDLKSKLGMTLKREMIKAVIKAVIKKSTYPNDNEKQKLIYDKYKDFILPEEEVEWLGLNIYEAEAKQEQLEEEERLRNIVPVKNTYLSKFIEKLHEGEVAQQKPGLLQKLNPFKSSEAKDN